MNDSSTKRKYIVTFLQKDGRDKTSESWVKAVKDNFSGNEPLKKPKCGPSFTNIPEDIFIRICSFLPMLDVWRLGSVCRLWYNFTRSEHICGRFDIASLNLSRKNARKLLLTLPDCVKELKIGKSPSYIEDYSLNIPALYYTLLERFPQLNTLIIEDVILTKPYSDYNISNGFVLNCKVPISLQTSRYFQKMQYLREQKDADFYTLVYVLQDLKVLSLRGSTLAVNDVVNAHIPPSRIRVLDLTNFLCATDLTIRTLCQLPFLEELYLAGTSITVNGVCVILKEVPRLKVLDLDGTVVGGETFEALRYQGQSLVELCLGKTAIRNCDMIDLDEEAFPALRKLCLHSTEVSEVGIKKLLLSVSSLSRVIVCNSKVKISWIVDQPVYIRAKLVYENYARDGCNHFLQNTFNGVF